jgi:hypothetical protein
MAEQIPTIEQLAEQLRKATELSAKLPQPYKSIHRELAAVYDKVKRAERKRPDSPNKIGDK